MSNRNIIAPGPGHSRAEPSLSIKIEPSAPDGFVVHSFAGDSPIECLEYVRARLCLGERDRRRRQPAPLGPASPTVASDNDATHRSALALGFWSEARDRRLRPHQPNRDRAPALAGLAHPHSCMSTNNAAATRSMERKSQWTWSNYSLQSSSAVWI